MMLPIMPGLAGMGEDGPEEIEMPEVCRVKFQSKKIEILFEYIIMLKRTYILVNLNLINLNILDFVHKRNALQLLGNAA